MSTTTIKTVSDVDYVVYFDGDKKLIGYEMSEDDKNAFQIRYKTPDNCGVDATIPEKAAYFLEVFGVASTLAFLIHEEGVRGELLFYRPSSIEMSREIGKTIDSMIALSEEKKEEPKSIPCVVSDARMKDILDRVPYPNWMDECWGTAAWIQVWKFKPHLQVAMLEFSAAKYKDRQKETRDPKDCIYNKDGKGLCIIEKGAPCKVDLCSEYETL